jgi:hypothetical protein
MLDNQAADRPRDSLAEGRAEQKMSDKLEQS